MMVLLFFDVSNYYIRYYTKLHFKGIELAFQNFLFIYFLSQTILVFTQIINWNILGLGWKIIDKIFKLYALFF